jgi:alpha-amylase/alpha-mannosidase (GH57 family)
MTHPLPIRLVLMWHMHQPDFRDSNGEFTQPWVYLHAIKDYADMAAHLENHPAVHAVVNLVPILLDQLDDYSDQFATGELRYPLLRLHARENLDRSTAIERDLVLHQCFRANHSKMIEPYTAYKRLRDLYQSTVVLGADPTAYLSGEYLSDLLTWYHLSWMGETVRRKEATVVQLMTRG